MPGKIVLFTNARNEQNMKEWAAHHLLLGFDRIIIFDHKSNIPLKNTFINFDKRVKVLRCEINNPVKIKLMNRAIQIAKQHNMEWIMYLDADEFLVLNKFMNIRDLVNHYGRYADLISMNWLMFGTNFLIKSPKGLIVESYTKSEASLNKHVKSIVRASQAVYADNPHYYHIRNPARMITVDNKLMNSFLGYSFNECKINYNVIPAFIAHYIYQSEETYVKRKLELPSDDTGASRKPDINIHNCYNDVINNRVKNMYAERIKRFLEHYKV